MNKAASRITSSSSSRLLRSFIFSPSQRFGRYHLDLTRHVHTPRALLYPIEQGLGSFLPPEALKVVAVDWQNGLLERLNEEVKDSELQYETVVGTVIRTAPDREKTLAFNYASLALNNSFFLDNLKPLGPEETSHEDGTSALLANQIREQFGSVSQLKSDFAAAATGMASSGWIWFVMAADGTLGVVPTFGAGTLLVRSRMHMGLADSDVLGEDVSLKGEGAWPNPNPTRTNMDSWLAPKPTLNTTAPTSSSSSSSPSPSGPRIPLGQNVTPGSTRKFHGTPSASLEVQELYKDQYTAMGDSLRPLFCISVHEHAWLSAGFGVWGKQEYLEKFWTVLDWEKVSRTFERYGGHKYKVNIPGSGYMRM